MLSIMHILLIFIITFIVAIDQFNLFESLYQPIVLGPVVGAILGDVQTGLMVGGTYQLMNIGNMPVGGAQPPNAVLGGIVATILAVSLHLEPAQAVGTAVPVALLGQYIVMTVFKSSALLMVQADQAVSQVDGARIARLNYYAMARLGMAFASVVVVFYLLIQLWGGLVVEVLPNWIWQGIGVGGNLMRFAGFAILLKVMGVQGLWKMYLGGFGLAIVLSVLLPFGSYTIALLALLGLAFVYYDFQKQIKLKATEAELAEVDEFDELGGGDEDGI